MKKELKRYTWDDFVDFVEESEKSGSGDYEYYYDVHGSALAFQFNDDYIDKLENNLAKCKEALEFYANENNWTSDLGCGHMGVIDNNDHIETKHPDGYSDKHMILRGGKKAIEVLKEILDS